MEVLGHTHHRLRAAEDGIALVSVILLLMILFAAAAAMTMSGQTELWIARNDEAAAQAHAAAEAGLNRGVDVTLTYLQQWRVNGFPTTSAAMSRLLRGPDNAGGTAATDADNGSLELLGLPRPPARQPLGALAGVAYEVQLFDDDDPAREVTLSAADRTRITEDGNPTTDGNSRIVVRAIGYATADTRVTLEATLGPRMLPALLTRGSLEIEGNPSIVGTHGSVHTNQDLEIDGSVTVSGNATASGDYEEDGRPRIGGDRGGGRPPISVPPVRASDYRSVADFVLTSSGRITDANGNIICADNDTCGDLGYGWAFDGSGWELRATSTIPGTYYVEGDAEIGASLGSPASPVPLTVIAEGEIEVNGNHYLTPETPGLMFVTD